ncbi:Cof-type HAD-IIB family hydrolase [Lysinibacillus sp. KU-BSD001]|uniref:Cof-type HAD-IIB family hydrolase n=1 Tax=Lysinibacillus sp. KU-BSD001 TaxID=3141328 RepID=UPI0036EDE791
MKKILFFDVDGTLYDSEKCLPHSTKEALFSARKNGYEIAIATGRAPFMITSLLEELEIDTYVTFNGQYVVYKGEVIFTDSIPRDYLQQVIAFGERRGEPVVFLDDREMIASLPDNHKVASSLATLKYPYPRIDAAFYEVQAVYQTLIFVEEKDEHLYRKAFPEVQFVRWHPYSCDILPKSGSKARGIEKILQHIGKTMDDAVAFGDGLNDIEMLQAVGLGIAMDNGHDRAKAVANVIAPHVDDDGIYKIMKEFGMI